MIRAVQGHSLKAVQDDQLLVRLGTEQRLLPEKCVHATYSRNWTSIKEKGLIAGGVQAFGERNHIHFMPYDYNDKRVISGMRPGRDLAIYVDLSKAMLAGIPFFMSVNEVILSPGQNGVIHPKYFQAVKNITTGEVQYAGGQPPCHALGPLRSKTQGEISRGERDRRRSR